ncbi:MAG: hypothetical protein WDA08_06785 [Weeksellaceae bacterium]
MKNFYSLFIAFLMAGSISNAQIVNPESSWSLSGNNILSSNYFGTNNNQSVIFKTNGLKRMTLTKEGNLQLGDITTPYAEKLLQLKGSFLVKTDQIDDDDLVDFVNDTPNVLSGNDVLWIAYSKYQPNNPGLLTVSGIESPNSSYVRYLTVRANGKIGIGTVEENFDCIDCENYRLFVKDGIKTEKIKVELASAGGWADYVFSDNYNLLPLSEVEEFISKNKHLPNMPSAEKIVEDGGFELKEMNIKLLEKIEELTLYIIEQNKRIEVLESKIKADN